MVGNRAILQAMAANRRAFFKLIEALEEATNSDVDPLTLESILDAQFSDEEEPMSPADVQSIIMEVSRRRGKRV